MKTVKKIFGLFLLTATLCGGFSSCGSHCYDDEDGIQGGPGNQLHDQIPMVYLNISPLSGSSRSTNGPVERISSLRIVMLNNDKIEFNHFFPIDNSGNSSQVGSGNEANPGANVDGFNYRYEFPTFKGTKSFFLIGNEQVARKVKFQVDDVDMSQYPGFAQLKAESETDEGISLSKVLSFFTNPTPDNFTDLPGEFALVMKSLYFTPDYTPNSGNNIYLPYSAYYQGYEISEEAETASYPITMYLVPGATRFRFQFRNLRDNDVEVPSCYISGLASDMYLFGKVDSSEETKKFNSKDYWWVDWMECIAQMSNNGDYDDGISNGVFNNRYGWISKFEIPTSAYPDATKGEYKGEDRPGMFQLIEGTNYFMVGGRVSGDPVTGFPGTSSTGYFYYPESRNIVDQNIVDEDGKIVGTTKVQKYYLTITMRETQNNDPGTTMDTEIGNLSSMFRATNTLITITMRDKSHVGAYAEPERWNVTHTSGNLIEDSTPQ